MRFSVIIPVYNVKNYLEKCIDSVLAQSAEDIEILLIDDGSTDGASGQICDRYALNYPEIIHVIHQENGGLGAARNTGIEHASGKYLLFLDSDDYLLPGLMERMREIVSSTVCDIVDFGFIVDQDGRVKETHAGEIGTQEPFTLREHPEMLLVLPAAWRRLYHRDLFLRSGIRYPSRVWYEDIRTTLKLYAEADRIISIPEAYYGYVVREGSITRNKNVTRNAEILDAFDDLRAWFSSKGLWENYYNEFSKLAVDHILLAASVRVLRTDPKSELLEAFRQYMKEHFPDYMDNPYLNQLSVPHKLAFKLLRAKRYSAVKTLFEIKDKLS